MPQTPFRYSHIHVIKFKIISIIINHDLLKEFLWQDLGSIKEGQFGNLK